MRQVSSLCVCIMSLTSVGPSLSPSCVYLCVCVCVCVCLYLCVYSKSQVCRPLLSPSHFSLPLPPAKPLPHSPLSTGGHIMGRGPQGSCWIQGLPLPLLLTPSLPPLLHSPSLPHSLSHSLTPSLPPSLPPSLLPPCLPPSLPPSANVSINGGQKWSANAPHCKLKA